MKRMEFRASGQCQIFEIHVTKGQPTRGRNKKILENTKKLYYALKHTFVSHEEAEKKTNLTVYKKIFKPMVTFGCES